MRTKFELLAIKIGPLFSLTEISLINIYRGVTALKSDQAIRIRTAASY